jgi:hypothetical protein
VRYTYIHQVSWEVEGTNEFSEWFDGLNDAEQASVIAVVDLLEEHGATLQFPHSWGVQKSRHDHMRELRIQHQGSPYRVLYCFDPRRTAILLIGGDKTGNDRWYDIHVPKADAIYDQYLADLKKEGLL